MLFPLFQQSSNVQVTYKIPILNQQKTTMPASAVYYSSNMCFSLTSKISFRFSSTWAHHTRLAEIRKSSFPPRPDLLRCILNNETLSFKLSSFTHNATVMAFRGFGRKDSGSKNIFPPLNVAIEPHFPLLERINMGPDILPMWSEPDASRTVKPEVFAKLRWTRRWGILAERKNFVKNCSEK